MKDVHLADNSWNGILDEGEELLWQGQPVAKVVLEDIKWLEAGMGVFFMGFSLFWMAGAAQAGGIFWMFGLIFFAIGLRNSLGQLVIDPWIRRHTYYSLSNRRAFVASRKPVTCKTLKTYVIDSNTALELEKGQTDTVYFATEQRRRRKGGSYTVKIGFEHMDGSTEPYKLLEQIRRGDV